MAMQLLSHHPYIRDIAGMQNYHATRLQQFTNRIYKNRLLLIIVRGSKPMSLAHHGRYNTGAKPHYVKEKVDPASGLAVTAKGIYFSDYDLQGVYEQRHMGDFVRLYIDNSTTYTMGAEFKSENYRPDQEVPFLTMINQFVCGGHNRMFMHGPNDDYVKAGRPQNPNIGNVFLAFEPSGIITLLSNQTELKEFYHSKRISFNY
jgi:hypothetical protein